jgi:hypothetical protein
VERSPCAHGPSHTAAPVPAPPQEKQRAIERGERAGVRFAAEGAAAPPAAPKPAVQARPVPQGGAAGSDREPTPPKEQRPRTSRAPRAATTMGLSEPRGPGEPGSSEDDAPPGGAREARLAETASGGRLAGAAGARPGPGQPDEAPAMDAWTWLSAGGGAADAGGGGRPGVVPAPPAAPPAGPRASFRRQESSNGARTSPARPLGVSEARPAAATGLRQASAPMLPRLGRLRTDSLSRAGFGCVGRAPQRGPPALPSSLRRMTPTRKTPSRRRWSSLWPSPIRASCRRG